MPVQQAMPQPGAPVAAAQPMRGGSDNAAALRRRRAWVGRVLLGVLAVAGTIAYALSFRTVPTAAAWLPPAGAAVGAAAGVSWLAFGAVLMLFTRGRPAPLEWADACLRTMAAGIAVLTVGTAFNLGVSPLRGRAFTAGRGKNGAVLHALFARSITGRIAGMLARPNRRQVVRTRLPVLAGALGQHRRGAEDG